MKMSPFLAATVTAAMYTWPDREHKPRILEPRVLLPHSKYTDLIIVVASKNLPHSRSRWT